MGIIYVVKARRLIKKGHTAYLAREVDTQASRIEPSKVPKVSEYLDVFPEELSGLPPRREIEFTIEVAPWTTPISQTPYCMAPSKN